MELSREILKRFAQIANGNSNKKQTTPSYMNATAVVSDGVKYVQIDGSDQLTPVSETMGIQNGDRVLVTIENHQATVIGNYSYPADARTANEALSVGGQALTAAGQAIQRIDVLQASSITTENLQAGLASIGYLTATELRALNATVDTLDAKAITTDTLETESAKIGFVKAAQIEGTYATIEQLNAATARIGTLETDTLKSKDLESEVGKFGYLKADEAKLTYATIEQLNAKTVTADEILGVVIKAGYLTAYNADLKYATITSLNAATARIGTLETDTLKTKDLESEVGKFGYLKASNLESEVGEFGYLKADDAEVTYATIKQLDTESARIDVVTGDLASYKTVVAGQFTANDAVISELKAKDAELNTAIIGKASISELDAIKTRTGTLESNVADIDDLVNGNLTSDNIHSLVIAGDKFSIENGFIKNAMIENMSFDKITGFDINTTNFTVHSNDGKSTWTDNTIQISDSNRIRVQIGKDASGDYNIYIWDVNGNLMFDPLYGVQASGIKQAIIRNDMVSETAAIAGSKLDIESVVTEINGATTKLKSTTIYLDSEKQTLDVAFNTMETTITNNLNAAKEYANGVGSNTLSSAQQYAVEKANAALASANKHTDDELADIEEITTSHSTQIGVIQGQITSLISEDSSIKGDYNVLLSRYNSTVSDVDSIKSTIGEHTTLINSQNGEIEAVQTQVNTIESDLSGTKQTVSSMQTTVNSTESRVTTVETNLNGLTARVSETETDMSGLESRVSTAETTLTKDGLTTIIGTYYSTPENVDDAIENLEIGGRNLIPNSNFANGTDGWIGYNDVSFRVGNDTYYAKALIINHSNIIGSNPSKGMVYKAANDFVHESDTTYTLSFMAKTTGASSGAEPILFSAAVKLSSNDIAKSKTHNITSSQWQKFTYTYTTGTIASDVVLAFWIANGPGPIHITNIKLEKGNKATDWTPAPEDVQGQIDSNVSKISSHETRITANEEAINLRVTSQEFTEYQNGVAANFSSIDTSLSVLNGAIESKVEQVDINNAIAGLEIGGRNLIRGTKDMSGFYTNSANLITDEDGFTFASFSPSSLNYWKLESTVHPISFSVVRNKEVVLSFYARSDDWESLNASASNGILLTFVLCDAESTTKLRSRDVKLYTCNLSNEWQKIFITATLSDDYFTSGSGTIDDTTRIYIRFNNYSECSMQVKQFKLELGNKATDWTPAPEDVDSQITSVKTIATQTADKFNWIVASGTSSTDFTLTDRTATLIAETISLNGDVKVNGDMLVDGSITTDKLYAYSVTTEKLATDAIKSSNYSYSSGNFSSAGTFLDLTTGLIRSKNFAITSDGSAYFSGELHSTVGSIGGWVIGDNCIYSSVANIANETTQVVLQNVIANEIFGNSYVSVNNCTVTVSGNYFYVTPMETASTRITFKTLLKAGTTKVYFYSGYASKYSHNIDYTFQYMNPDGTYQLETYEVAWEADSHIVSPDGYTVCELTVTCEVPDDAIDATVFFGQSMPNATEGETYAFALSVEQDGVIDETTPILSAAGVTIDKFLAVKKTDADGTETMPLYMSANGTIYTEGTVTAGSLYRYDTSADLSYTVLDTGNYTTTLDARYVQYITTNGHPGLAVNGDDSMWIRTPSYGIIPYQSGSAGSGHGSIGTSSWYYSRLYVDYIYTVGITCAGNLSVYNGSTQTPLFITGYAGNETSIRYAYNGGSYYWVVGPGAGYADFSKFGWYTNANGPIANISTSGTFTTKGEVIAGSSSANAFRAVYGNYGLIMRNDGNAFYFLATNSGDPYGAWNTSYYPLSYNFASNEMRINGSVFTSSYVRLLGNSYAIQFGTGFSSGTTSLTPRSTSGGKADGVVVLGASSSRWSTCFAKNGTSTSSDERDKEIFDLDQRYKALFMKTKTIAYRWTDDDSKIIHIGTGAQSFEQSAHECGLSTEEIGAIRHDYWDEPNEDGRTDRYSINYDELLMLAVPFVQSHELTLTEHAAKLINIEAQLEAMKVELDEAHMKIAAQDKVIAELEKLVNAS